MRGVELGARPVCGCWQNLQEDGQAARGAASIEAAADRGSDISEMCYLWSDVPLTANLWSQLACCCSPLWWLSKRVIEECGRSAGPAVRRRRRDAAVPAVEAFHLRHRRSAGGSALDPCAVAIHGVVPQRGGLRVWQPWSGSGSLAPRQAARARDSDAMGLLGASNRREIRGQECCRRRRVQSAFFGGRTTRAVDGSRPLPARGADSVCPAPPIDGRAGARRDPPGEVRSSHRAQRPRGLSPRG